MSVIGGSMDKLLLQWCDCTDLSAIDSFGRNEIVGASQRRREVAASILGSDALIQLLLRCSGRQQPSKSSRDELHFKTKLFYLIQFLALEMTQRCAVTLSVDRREALSSTLVTAMVPFLLPTSSGRSIEETVRVAWLYCNGSHRLEFACAVVENWVNDSASNSTSSAPSDQRRIVTSTYSQLVEMISEAIVEEPALLRQQRSGRRSAWLGDIAKWPKLLRGIWQSRSSEDFTTSANLIEHLIALANTLLLQNGAAEASVDTGVEALFAELLRFVDGCLHTEGKHATKGTPLGSPLIDRRVSSESVVK